MRVTASAPGKLMLLGEHAVVYGHPCLVTAVDRRIWVTVERAAGGVVHLSAPALGVDDCTVSMARVCTADSPRGVRFLLAAVCCMAQRHSLAGGLRIETRSSFSDELGLGSSAAVTIAAVATLSAFMRLELSKDALFALGHEAVRSVQGVGSGFDLAASLYGGTLHFRRPQEATWDLGCCPPDVTSLSADPLPLIVGYSGTKADTASLMSEVARRCERQPALIGEIFNGVGRLVEEARDALLAQDWQRLGQAMSLNQSLLDALGVNTPKLAQLVSVAEEAGAYGAKLSGAGGGDCMVALTSDERWDEVRRAIQGAGGRVIPLRTGAPGLRREDSRRIRIPHSTDSSPSIIR
jgi:mevalonate kinase